jgi:hypothetical protein
LHNSRNHALINALALALAIMALPAYAEEGVSSVELDEYNLSDEQIAERCKAAIAGKLDLITTEDGRRITTCQHTYETARAVATNYQTAEKGESDRIGQANNNCDANNTQEKCLRAGDDSISGAESAHESLATNAEKGEETLAQLVGR